MTPHCGANGRNCGSLWASDFAPKPISSAREVGGDSAQSYLEQAYYFERAEAYDAARDAFDIGLMMKHADGDWGLEARECLQRAGNEKLPAYQRLAWLDWGVEHWPDDVQLRLARARFLMSRDFQRARADLEHALQIAPTDPALYQARAELYLNWWSFGARERFVRASADYATIVRLEIAAGLAPSDAQLLADVEAGEGQNPRDDEEKFAMVRRHARFSVALELAPHDAHMSRSRRCSIFCARFKLTQRWKVRLA